MSATQNKEQKNPKKTKLTIKKPKTISEFSKFILRGNVIDLAVGIIIGGAFNKIVSSLVDDVLTPILSIFIHNVNFSEMKIPLAFLDIEPTPTINAGNFLSSVIGFIIMGFVVFMLVKTINKIRITAENFLPKEEKTELTEKNCPFCISKIKIQATKCPYCTSQLNSVST